MEKKPQQHLLWSVCYSLFAYYNISVSLTTPSLPDRVGCQKLHLPTALGWMTAAICNLNLSCAHLCSLTVVLLECVPPDGIAATKLLQQISGFAQLFQQQNIS